MLVKEDGIIKLITFLHTTEPVKKYQNFQYRRWKNELEKISVGELKGDKTNKSLDEEQ